MPLKDLLFGFEGRIRRRDWWLASIAMGLAQTLTTRVADTLLFGADADLQAGNYVTWFVGSAPGAGPQWTALAFAIVFLWPALALILKRAHDRDRRGWELVAIHIAAATGYLFPADAYESAGRAMDAADWLAGAPMMAWGLVIIVASLYQLVVLGFLDGTRGPNRFGRSPKGIGGDPANTAAEVFS